MNGYGDGIKVQSRRIFVTSPTVGKQPLSAEPGHDRGGKEGFMKRTNNRGKLWSIVLAGGEGTRVGSFVQRWLGRPRPKQFCTFVGTRSMLQHTLDRAARLASVERSVLVIAHTHRQEAMIQLDGRGVGTVLLQPANRGTGAGVFFP